jgi:hypothetical protein
MTIKYVPTVLEDPPEPSKVTQWSLGIAMFAAFVIPFVLLASSARYQVFVAQAKHKLNTFGQASEPNNHLSCGRHQIAYDKAFAEQQARDAKLNKLTAPKAEK